MTTVRQSQEVTWAAVAATAKLAQAVKGLATSQNNQAAKVVPIVKHLVASLNNLLACDVDCRKLEKAKGATAQVDRKVVVLQAMGPRDLQAHHLTWNRIL